MIRSPIFIVGLNKSGTSLVYLMLSRHPALSAIRAFKPPRQKPGTATLHMENYGIGEGQKIAGLVEKLRSGSQSYLFACPPVLDDYRLTERDAETGERELVAAAYHGAMVNPGARLVEKSPPNLVRTRYLQALFPDASIIHIVRDPYANVAANAKKRGRWGTVRDQARHWASGNGLYLEDSASLRRALTIRYEDLAGQPERTMQAICAFCGLEWRPTIMEPVTPGVNGQMVGLLAPDEADEISAVIRPQLFKAFGYRRQSRLRRWLRRVAA